MKAISRADDRKGDASRGAISVGGVQLFMFQPHYLYKTIIALMANNSALISVRLIYIFWRFTARLCDFFDGSARLP